MTASNGRVIRDGIEETNVEYVLSKFIATNFNETGYVYSYGKNYINDCTLFVDTDRSDDDLRTGVLEETLIDIRMFVREYNLQEIFK